MKNLCHAVLGMLVLLGGAGSLGAQTGSPSAQAAHVYFQAAIHDRDGVVTGAHALVRVGATADLALGPKSRGRALRLRYSLEEAPIVPTPAAGQGSEGVKVGFRATVTGMVDNREVVVGTLEWSDREVSALTMQDGDLVWTIEAQNAANLPAR